MDRFFAGPAQAERGEGDTDLHDGEKALRIFEKLEGGFGAGVSFVGELLNAGFPGAEQGRLGGGEESVRGDDQTDE